MCNLPFRGISVRTNHVQVPSSSLMWPVALVCTAWFQNFHKPGAGAVATRWEVGRAARGQDWSQHLHTHKWFLLRWCELRGCYRFTCPMYSEGKQMKKVAFGAEKSLAQGQARRTGGSWSKPLKSWDFLVLQWLRRHEIGRAHV